MHVLITVFDHVICTTQDAPLHCLPFCKVKWQHFEGMWQILHASFSKFSKLSKSRIYLNWSIILTKLQPAIQQLTFLAHSVYLAQKSDYATSLIGLQSQQAGADFWAYSGAHKGAPWWILQLMSQQHGFSFPVPKFPIWFPVPISNPLCCALYRT